MASMARERVRALPVGGGKAYTRALQGRIRAYIIGFQGGGSLRANTVFTIHNSAYVSGASKELRGRTKRVERALPSLQHATYALAPSSFESRIICK